MNDTAKPIAAVFIHGIFSNAGIWARLFEFLLADQFIAKNVSLVLFSYPSPKISMSLLKRIPNLLELGQALEAFLQTKDEIRRARRIVLVGHSQGGLIIQQYLASRLRSGRASDLERIAECVFFATPTNGSEFLLSLRVRLGRLGLWHHPQEARLRPLNEQIGELQRTILAQCVYAAAPTDAQWPLRIAAYAGSEDAVVTSQSAQWVFKERGILPGTHSSIIQPATSGDLVVRIMVDALRRARHPEQSDVELLETKHVSPDDRDTFDAAVALHRESGSASLSARREDIAHWLGRYEDTFGIKLRVIAARHNNKVVGFLMFHADAKRNLIVVDYLRRRHDGPMDGYLLGKLMARLREAARDDDITRIVFEVGKPAAGIAGRRNAALVRLWERFGARVIPELSYETLDMDRFPAPGSSEPHLLMYARTGDAPETLARAEVEELITYLYGTWFGNWLSHRWEGRLRELKQHLDDLTAKVLSSLPTNTRELRMHRYRDVVGQA